MGNTGVAVAVGSTVRPEEGDPATVMELVVVGVVTTALVATA